MSLVQAVQQSTSADALKRALRSTQNLPNQLRALFEHNVNNFGKPEEELTFRKSVNIFTMASKYFLENAVGQNLALEVAEKLLLVVLANPLPEVLTAEASALIADIITCLNQFFGSLEGLDSVIPPVLKFISTYFAHTATVFSKKTVSVESTQATDDSAPTESTPEGDESAFSLSVSQEEEYINLISLCTEFLLGLESVPQDNADILSPLCNLYYQVAKLENSELESHLLECITHILLLGLPFPYHEMPNKVKERFAFQKAEKEKDSEEDEDEDDDSEDDHETDTEKFTPFSPSISGPEILSLQSHLLEKLKAAHTNSYQSLCLALNLVTIASYEFPAGKDSDLRNQAAEVLLNFIIDGLNSFDTSQSSKQKNCFLYAAGTILEGMDATSIPTEKWSEIYTLLVEHHKEAKKWGRSGTRVQQKQQQKTYQDQRSAIISAFTELLYKGDKNLPNIASTFFMETGPLFADPLLFCDALVAFAKQQKGQEMLDAEFWSELTEIHVPRIVQQIVPQITRTGPSLKMKKSMVTGLSKIISNISPFSTAIVSLIIDGFNHLIHSQLLELGLDALTALKQLINNESDKIGAKMGDLVEVLSNLTKDDCPWFLNGIDSSDEESSDEDPDEDLTPQIQVLALKILRDLFKNNNNNDESIVTLKISLLQQLEAQCTKDRIFDSDNVLCAKRLELIHTTILSLASDKEIQKKRARSFLTTLENIPDIQEEEVLNVFKEKAEEEMKAILKV
eukprot:TRINITY_DN2511_c0_g2_i1.p1 TRINITY_DN2511_c0_g2~~TRINITY_DN2511_c0_g2_i1.p1  ORF type:complete len:739 (-),score=211.18 TRINITY_DN2511_c0_g2_i1:17-2233(-)